MIADQHHVAETPQYSIFEDLQGLLISTIQCALAIHLLREAGLITGGTAGLALLVSYWSGYSFGWMFFLINIPVYAFAYKTRGALFTLKSFLTVTVVSLMADALPNYLPLDSIPTWLAAVLFGVIAGVGLLGLFRHSASLGGVSIVAMILQDKLGLRAGWILLGYDITLFAVAFWTLAPSLVLWSLAGAALMNGVIMLNHRRDWYVVT